MALVSLTLVLAVPLLTSAAPPFPSAFSPTGGLPDFWPTRVRHARALRTHSDMVIRPGMVDEMRRRSIRTYFPGGNEIAICNRELGLLRQKHSEFLAAREQRMQSRLTFTQDDLNHQLSRLRLARKWVIDQAAQRDGELGKRLRKYEQTTEDLSAGDFENGKANLDVTARQVNKAKRQAEEINGVFKRAMEDPDGTEVEFKPEGSPPRFEIISVCTVREGHRYCSTTSYKREGLETGNQLKALRVAVWGDSAADPTLTLEQYYDHQARGSGLLSTCLDYDVLYGDHPLPARQAASDRGRAPQKGSMPEVPFPAPAEVMGVEGAR